MDVIDVSFKNQILQRNTFLSLMMRMIKNKMHMKSYELIESIELPLTNLINYLIRIVLIMLK